MHPGIFGQALAAQLLATPKTAGKSTPPSRVRSEVLRTVEELNHSWTAERDLDKLKNFFHPTLRTSRNRGLPGGAAARKQLMDAGQIEGWKMSDPKVQLYGENNFAIVNYFYEMTVLVAGRSLFYNGWDMLALVKDNGRWWIVADQCTSSTAHTNAAPVTGMMQPASGGNSRPRILAAPAERAPLRWIECDYDPEKFALTPEYRA